jgi:hypothetical protein
MTVLYKMSDIIKILRYIIIHIMCIIKIISMTLSTILSVGQFPLINYMNEHEIEAYNNETCGVVWVVIF